MVNIYTAPGSKTEERHALNNTRAEMQAGLGPCQIGVETDQLKLGFKDHLGNYHSCGDAGDSFKVKLNHDTTEGYLEDILVPAAGGAVSLSGVGDTMEADVGVDNATIEKNAGALRVKDEGITDAKVATANKDGTAGTYSMRSIGTGALQACSGADARLSDARAPTAHASTHNAGGGDALAIDAAAGTGSFRTLGTGALQACAGNDGRLSDSRAPTAHKATHEPGGSDAMDVGAAANVGSLRKIGTGALEACAGNDSRLSDARTPIAHASTHNAGGSDAMAIDSAAGTGSLRTLGTASTSACAGNDSRLSDARTPTAHSHAPSDVTGTAITKAANEFPALTGKSALVAADLFLIEDSAASYAKKKVLASDMFGNIYQVKKTYINTSGITTAIDIYVDRAPYGMTLQSIYVIRKGGTGATINALNAANTYLASNFSITFADALMDAGTLQYAATSEGALITLRIATVAGSPTQIGFFLLYKRVV